MITMRESRSKSWVVAHNGIINEIVRYLNIIELKPNTKLAIKGSPDDLFRPVVVNVAEYPLDPNTKDTNPKETRYGAGILQVIIDPYFSGNQEIYILFVSQIITSSP